ncbi:MAG: Crp/Fnr family transcriptional regulator [bacterium]
MLSDEFDDYLKTYQPDRILFEEGETGECFYLIKEGLVSITRRDPEGKKLNLASLGPGEVVGEMALLEDNSTRSASARSQTRLTCWKFSADQFDALLQESQEFRNQILELLSNRLRKSNEQLVEDQHRDNLLYQAAAAILYVMEDKNLYDESRATVTITPPLRSLRETFDLSPDVLEAYLAHASLDDLRSLAPEVQSILEDAARTILESGLDATDFTSPYSKSSLDLDASLTFKDFQEVLDSAKSLYSRINQLSSSDLMNQKDDLLQQFRILKEEYESAQADPTLEDKKTLQLKAYIDGTREVLIEESIIDVNE